MRIITYRDGENTRTALLASVTGADEASLEVSGRGAYALLRRVARSDDGSPLAIDSLPISDCDRLLAAIYADLYGDSAECRVDCRACEEAFQFTLHLSEIIAAQDAEKLPPPGADGAWELPDGRRVRAPTLADLATADPDELVRRLLVAGESQSDESQVEQFLERAAPVLSIDLDVDCPNCGSHDSVRFDLAHYFSARLAGERPFLIRETHLIAARYGWSQREIHSISRSDRRAYAGLIEAERASAQRARRVG